MVWLGDGCAPEDAVSGGPGSARSGPRSRRRTSGEGGLYRRADGMWTASVELQEVDGKRKRKVVHAADRAGVQAKVRERQDRLHKGLPPLDWSHSLVRTKREVQVSGRSVGGWGRSSSESLRDEVRPVLGRTARRRRG